jgi:uncharacterized surface protein with fasciclin (FAS1) repeats
VVEITQVEPLFLSLPPDMLIPKFATLLCSGVLAAAALKLAAPEGQYGEGLVPKLMYESSHAQQNPLDASKLRSAQEVFKDNQEIGTVSKTAENRTIYQILSDSNNFSRLVKIINISDEIVSLLNNTSAGITFFAPSNQALRPPHHRKIHHGHISSLALSHPAAVLSETYDLSEILSEIEELQVDDDPDKERRKKIIKILVRAILAYHVLPQGLDASQLTRNTTYATNLTIPDGALDKEALRIRVTTSKVFPAIKINLLATVVKSDIGAANGIIHVVNHPLLPPPSIFQELFLIPEFFGTVTSALQRLGLTKALEWRYVSSNEKYDKDWTVEGTGSTTFFVPSNIAFKKLPKKLQLFLFSPFGEKVLKKLLGFHVVPGIVLHSDYLHNTTSGKTISAISEGFDLSDDILFADSVDKIDFSDVLCHEGRPFPSGHGEPEKQGHYDDCKCRHPFPPRAGWEPREIPPPPSSPPCQENLHRPPPPLHRPPPPPAPRAFRDPNNIGDGSPGQGSHSPCPPSHKPLLSRPPLVFAANLTLPTLLTNHSLHVHIAKFKYHLPIPGQPKDIYISKFFVNHRKVEFADVVARNGAVHVINSILNPHPRHRHKPKVVESSKKVHEEDNDDGWQDWEDWLPQWAAEN